jgi:sortase A
METEKRRIIRAGIVLMAFGLAFIAAAGGLFAYNTITDRKAGQTARDLLSAVEQVSEESTFEQEANGEPFAIIDGKKYIGVITIPSLGIDLPVQSDWSLEKLKDSPCRYYGSVIDGTAVICAHNYQSHFGKLKYAAAGEIVYFTDTAGLTYAYKIASVEQIDGYDIEKMKENTGWDLTLFTCTYSGRQRQTIRLVRVQSVD